MEGRPGVFLLCHKFLMIKKEKTIENLLLKLKLLGWTRYLGSFPLIKFRMSENIRSGLIWIHVCCRFLLIWTIFDRLGSRLVIVYTMNKNVDYPHCYSYSIHADLLRGNEVFKEVIHNVRRLISMKINISNCSTFVWSMLLIQEEEDSGFCHFPVLFLYRD